MPSWPHAHVGLIQLPIELLLKLFGDLENVNQIINFGATCRRTCDVLEEKGWLAIKNVVLDEIVAFEDALVSVSSRLILLTRNGN